MDDGDEHGERVRVWLVERTYSDDEQNLIVLTYATPDGTGEFRKERALTSFGDDRPTTASLSVDPDDLARVDAPEDREEYAATVERARERYGPDDPV